MPTLTAESVAGTHDYLAAARPEWERSMDAILREGGPWHCGACQRGSLLVYRCSRCGRDLCGE